MAVCTLPICTSLENTGGGYSPGRTVWRGEQLSEALCRYDDNKDDDHIEEWKAAEKYSLHRHSLPRLVSKPVLTSHVGQGQLHDTWNGLDEPLKT